MKSKSFTFFALISIVLAGLLFYTVISVQDQSKVTQNQNQISASEGYAAASIPKGTIILLLAVGVIGVLGISRKTKSKVDLSQHDEIKNKTGSQKIITPNS
jgi:hypothetical protein